MTGSKVHSFSSGGRAIRIETFPSKTDGLRPSVVLLHGANGMRSGNPVVSGILEHLGAREFLVHLFEYFDRTDTDRADDATIRQNYLAWLQTIEDGLAHVQREFPGRPIGMFGHSLGGYLTAVTLMRNPVVSAAVVLSGGLDEESAWEVQRTAPVLILHGTADTRVPITEARRLESVLVAKGAAPEFHTYEGDGHVLEMASYADALERAARFLRRTLV